MQVLLASDPTADKAAAALSVRCGTFQDPNARPGLAHFHEHMLFLGTEKYPKEDEYTRFLNEHGGDSNAFTMNEYTTYYFKVAAPHLGGALDRFAQFFVGPTFAESCVEREMNAVDSESTNYSTEDGWRMLQVLKATAKEEHPFFRFDVGNCETLGADNPLGTRSELIEWNKQHYQAGAMRLVVLGRDSLEDLEKTAIAQFGPVREGDGRSFEYSCLPWPQEKLGRVISCVPLKEARSISVCWPLPPVTKYLFAKPEVYISHILGHEGQGSLHDVLNQRGWVDQLSAGGAHSFSDGQLFSLSVTLTPEGDANRDAVLALLFEYVDLVREAGPQEEVFKEIAALQEISFAHKEDSPAPDDFAASAAMTLHKYPAEETLRGPFAVDEWKPDVVKEYLDSLTLDRCLVFVTSTAFEGEAGQEDAIVKGWQNEKWYGAPFREEPINEEQLAKWRGQDTEAKEPSGLRMPEPNRFVPTDFSLRGTVEEQGPLTTKLPTEITPPALISTGPFARIWYKTDNAFKTPRQYILGQVYSPAYSEGPRAVALMRLFCSVIYDDLNAFAYDADVAGLGYSLDFSDSLSLSVGGFSHKLPELLTCLLERIKKVMVDAESAAGPDGTLNARGEELFDKLEVQRQLLVQNYSNFTREEPWSVSQYYLGQIMLRDSWHLSEYLEALKEPFSLADMAGAARSSFAKTQVEILVHGNTTLDEAKKLSDTVTSSMRELASEDLPEVIKRKVTKLPEGSTTVFEYDLAAENPAQENSCTENVYQVGTVGEDSKRDAAFALICHIAGTSAYQRLRTEEQLGYIVQAFTWAEQHVCGLCVLVQGNRLPPRDVDLRIEEWLQSYGRELEEMPAEEFANNVRAVISERTQRLSRLSQETTRHWAEIQTRRYRFDKIARSIRALEALELADVLAVFRERIAAGAPARRKLSVRVLGTSTGEARSEAEEGVKLLTTLPEIRAFVEATEAWPPASREELPAPLEA